MNSAAARSAIVIAALFLAYEIVVGVVVTTTQLIVVQPQPISAFGGLTLWIGPVLSALPYAVATFFVFWLWRPRDTPRPWLRLIGRAVIAAAVGAVLAGLIGALAALEVSGDWFTSIPRQYTFSGTYLPQLPLQLVTGFLRFAPIIVLAAFACRAFLRRRARAFDREESVE